MSVVLESEFSSSLLSWPRTQLMMLSRWPASGSSLRPARIWPVALVWTVIEIGLILLLERIVPVAVTAGTRVVTFLVVVLDTVMLVCPDATVAGVAAAWTATLLNLNCVVLTTLLTKNEPL